LELFIYLLVSQKTIKSFFSSYFSYKKNWNALLLRTFQNFTEKKTYFFKSLDTLDNSPTTFTMPCLVSFFTYAIRFRNWIPVGTLLAGAGVAVLAFSFRAQGFVSDICERFFYSTRKQVDIGDVCYIQYITGLLSMST